MVWNLAIHLYQQVTRLFINPMFIVLQHPHHLMESTVAISHPLAHCICSAKKLLCHTFGYKHSLTGGTVFGQRHDLPVLGIFHAECTEYIATLCLHKLVILRMHLQCIIEVLSAIPRITIWETSISHQGKTFHFGTILYQAGNAIKIFLPDGNTILCLVKLTMQFIIIIHIKRVCPFFIITGVKGKIGSQHIDRINYRPEEKAHDD